MHFVFEKIVLPFSDWVIHAIHFIPLFQADHRHRAEHQGQHEAD